MILLIDVIVVFIGVPLLSPVLSIYVSVCVFCGMIQDLVVTFHVILRKMPATVSCAALGGRVATLANVSALRRLRM